MTLTKALDNYSDAQKQIKKQFIEDFSKVVLELKPDAKTFEFEGYSEYNDEGGSNMYFSSLTIDDEDLEEIVSELPKDKLQQIFDKEISEDRYNDKDWLWDSIRDEMYSLPEFVYDHGKVKIKCATA